jgi:tRNA-2-methylthio-N6-dimethylallyladenosine synthase
MKFYIETFGCQMNEHDSEKMAHLLRVDGFHHAENVADADVVIVNTCCIREKAEQKFYSLMGRLRSQKRHKGTLLGVAGCIAQLDKDSLADRLPYIDFCLGPGSIHRVGEAVGRALQRDKTLDFSDNGSTPALFIRPENKGDATAKYVTIMKGCNNFCSYCVVPYVRGRETSRESKDILDEIEALAGKGAKEVTLLGQNVNSYNKGRDDIPFPDLLKQINAIQGIERIRFVTSHPRDLSADLIACFGTLDKLCEHIHLPFQSGSDKVLGIMNRGYSVQEYRDKVELLRAQCPDIAITADCIVGFPGEEDEDFHETMELVERVKFDGLFSFVYSPRKLTAAWALPETVPGNRALERLSTLQKVQRAITWDKNVAMEGKTVEILVERQSKNSCEEMMGRTRSNKVTNFKGDDNLVGKLVAVNIAKGYANSLKGVTVKS